MRRADGLRPGGGQGGERPPVPPLGRPTLKESNPNTADPPALATNYSDRAGGGPAAGREGGREGGGREGLAQAAARSTKGEGTGRGKGRGAKEICLPLVRVARHY